MQRKRFTKALMSLTAYPKCGKKFIQEREHVILCQGNNKMQLQARARDSDSPSRKKPKKLVTSFQAKKKKHTHTHTHFSERDCMYNTE